MAYELVYTSVPKGIKPGSSGFCTVAYTNGLAANIALKLEGLSAYKPYFPHYDANAENNPVAFSHYTNRISGEDLHFVSRVGFYGLDYTKRSNKLAHHFVLRKNEAAFLPAGPAAIGLQEDIFISTWDSPPQLFPQQKKISLPAFQPTKADKWESYAGDAGWAGTLAQYYLDNPEKSAYIVFDPLKHSNILQLAFEAMQLLPQEKRWDVSFNTYFMTLPAGMNCHWRFCTPDCAALHEASRLPGILIIDLTAPLPPAGDGELENAARTGVLPHKEEPVCVMEEEKNVPQFSRKRTVPDSFRQQKNVFVQPQPGQQMPEQHSRKEKKRFPIAIVFVFLFLSAVSSVFFLVPQLKERTADPSKAHEPVKKKPAKKKTVKKNPKNTPREEKKPEERSELPSDQDTNKLVEKEDQLHPTNNSGAKSLTPDTPPAGKEQVEKKDGRGGEWQATEEKSKPPTAPPTDEIDKIRNNRRVLFWKYAKEAHQLHQKKGHIEFEQILFPEEKLKSLNIRHPKNGVSGAEEVENEFEIKNDRVVLKIEDGINVGDSISYFELKIISDANGKIKLEEDNKDFNKSNKYTIVAAKTNKGKIFFRYDPWECLWPEDEKDGTIKAEIDPKKSTITFTYVVPPLHKTAGLEPYICQAQISPIGDLKVEKKGRTTWVISTPSEISSLEKNGRKLYRLSKDLSECCKIDTFKEKYAQKFQQHFERRFEEKKKDKKSLTKMFSNAFAKDNDKEKWDFQKIKEYFEKEAQKKPEEEAQKETSQITKEINEDSDSKNKFVSCLKFIAMLEKTGINGSELSAILSHLEKEHTEIWEKKFAVARKEENVSLEKLIGQTKEKLKKEKDKFNKTFESINEVHLVYNNDETKKVIKTLKCKRECVGEKNK